MSQGHLGSDVLKSLRRDRKGTRAFFYSMFVSSVVVFYLVGFTAHNTKRYVSSNGFHSTVTMLLGLLVALYPVYCRQMKIAQRHL